MASQMLEHFASKAAPPGYASDVAVGALVAVPKDEAEGAKTWVRGQLTQTGTGGKATVMLLDYGSTMEVNASQLMPLPAKFNVNLAQASTRPRKTRGLAMHAPTRVHVHNRPLHLGSVTYGPLAAPQSSPRQRH